jgi:MFS-type transporter involved in bile tolerance (Atg22 family)
VRKLFSVLKYTKNYKGNLIANIVCNVLFAVFNAVSLTLVAPFLKLLFEKGAEIKLAFTLLKGPPGIFLVAYFAIP